ncbi:hypothetical protein EDC04DRAFT_2868225 [Pisolithus marmoratus]|nr:hypothetical protein EDC04DRAFT_2868225 [Pisolithus marmoratus]
MGTLWVKTLTQIIKGTFKDHLVSWVETYLQKHYKNDFAAVLADIDHLYHFSQGCGFKQWTGNDSKALMKGCYVPNEMLQALSAFMDFCYIVHQSSLGEADLEALDRALQHFETHCSIFEAEGIHSDGISIPQIHALQHYHEAVELFGAPTGLSTSIVESKHIHAVKRPYWAFGQTTNPTRHVHEDTSFQDDPYLQEAEDDDSERADAVVQLAHKPSPRKLRTLAEMGQDIGHLELPDLVSIFLFQQRNPGVDVPDISNKWNALQCIHASSSWRNGAPHYDCVFVEKDPTLPGFQGLYVAQWFTPIGNEPCINTGMWKVEHEYDEFVDHLVTHLIGIYGDEYIPPDLHYSDSLAAFGSFNVNKYSDYHAFGLAF